MKDYYMLIIGLLLIFAGVLLINPQIINAAQCINQDGYFCGPANRVFYCELGSNAAWTFIDDCSPGACSGGACLPF